MKFTAYFYNPVNGSVYFSLNLPESTKYTNPSIVNEVSATFVATTIFHLFS